MGLLNFLVNRIAKPLSQQVRSRAEWYQAKVLNAIITSSPDSFVRRLLKPSPNATTVYTASFLHETLHPERKQTTIHDFIQFYVRKLGEKPSLENILALPNFIWEALSIVKRHKHIRGLEVAANPSGTIEDTTYEYYCQQILDEIRQAIATHKKLDIILLHLHGASVSAGHEDIESRLLQQIRELVGDRVTIAVLFDLHGHHTRAKTQHANVILYYYYYPHTDLIARAKELFDVAVKIHQNKIKLGHKAFQMKLLNHMFVPERKYLPAAHHPMTLLMEWLQHYVASTKGLVLASIAHGFPWSDVKETGVTPIVYFDENTPGAEERADELAKALGLILYILRNDLKPQTQDIHTAIKIAQSKIAKGETKTVVLADYPDNPGGGADGNSTLSIEPVLREQIPSVAISSLYDPKAVALAEQHIGQPEFEITVGGNPDQVAEYGHPLRLKVRVSGFKKNFQQQLDIKSPFSAIQSVSLPLGDTACLQVLAYYDPIQQRWLEQNQVELLINSVCCQTLTPACFEAFGITPQQKQMLLVKSMYHWQADFSRLFPRTAFLTLGHQGRLTDDITQITYERWPKPDYWPFQSSIDEYEQQIRMLGEDKTSLLYHIGEVLEPVMGRNVVQHYLATEVTRQSSYAQMMTSEGKFGPTSAQKTQPTMVDLSAVTQLHAKPKIASPLKEADELLRYRDHSSLP